jgi:hypothetical protein
MLPLRPSWEPALHSGDHARDSAQSPYCGRVPPGRLSASFRDAADVEQHQAALAHGKFGAGAAPYSVVTALSHAVLVRDHNEDSIGLPTLCAAETRGHKLLSFLLPAHELFLLRDSSHDAAC